MENRAGGKWVLGVAGAIRYPTDGQGGATATAASSALVSAKKVEVLGIIVNVGAAVIGKVVDNAGADVPGLTMTFATTSSGFFPFAGHTGVLYENATSANIGISCGTALVATLVYRQIA